MSVNRGWNGHAAEAGISREVSGADWLMCKPIRSLGADLLLHFTDVRALANDCFAPEAVVPRGRFPRSRGRSCQRWLAPEVVGGRFRLGRGAKKIHTFRKMENSRMTKRNVRVRTRLPPWRRSADRTRLHANSLLSGNFTGNFATLRLPRPILQQETAVLQRLIERFPTQINRENNLGEQGISKSQQGKFLPKAKYPASLRGRLDP